MSDQSDLLFEPTTFALPGNEITEIEALSAGLPQPTPIDSTFFSTAQKNMLVKFGLLARLGMGSQTAKSLTKDDIKKMSFISESERRDSFDEDDLLLDEEIESYTNSEGDFSLNFFQRSDNEVRQAYLNRLINMGILKLQPKKKHQELIILDWDDTLLCTTYLSKTGLAHLPETVLEPLRMLDEQVCTLLELATEFGKTVIVTNAHEEWVKSTGMVFLPRSWAIIQDRVQVISARTRYEEEYPGDTYRWKIETFLDLKKELLHDVEANIVCVGDSRREIDAARCLGEQFEHSLVKTVKFKSNPGVYDLIKQISLLNERFSQIITNRTSLTIRLEKK